MSPAPPESMRFKMRFDCQQFLTRPVFVVATQRSGTNLLRKSLAATELFFDLNEVFDPFHAEFWDFKQRRLVERPELSLPATDNQLELWHGYLNQRLPGIKKPFTLIDVKYSSMHHLDSLWHEHGSAPLLVEWLSVNQFPVIHVVRENVLDTHVSNLLACRLQIWDAEDASAAEGVSFRLDPVETKIEIERRVEQIQMMQRLLRPLDCIEAKYESLVDRQKNRLSKQLVSDVKRLLQLHPSQAIDDVAVATKKMGRSAAELIENYAEITNAARQRVA